MDGYSLMMKKFLPLTFLLLFILDAGTAVFAQWAHDFRHRMEIPEIINVHSSETHLYILSESEGLIVFRTHEDSLQWLYSSTGMQQRGNYIESDIRFAYIYGSNRRLTIVEPTSVLGVYSSTVLPASPKSVERVANNLYIALGNTGLGKISLETPESVDASVEYPFENILNGNDVQSLASDRNRTLYVLSNGNQIDIFSLSSDEDEEGNLEHNESVETERNIEKLFITDDELIGTDRSGNIFLINSDGRMRQTARTNSAVDKLEIWNNHLVVRTVDGNLWMGEFGSELTEWKSDSDAGNYFTVTEEQLWVSEFNQISPVVLTSGDNSGSNRSSASGLALRPIEDITLPFPRPLILPIKLESSYEPGEVSFSYNASFNNASIRGKTFYWQPSATQTGRHRVTITATNSSGQSDSEEFMIDLRPFNAPPRFSSVRPISIPVNESFEYKIDAIDPDGMNQDLIRYLGVDLPDGARINEKNGRFTWTPNIRQVGSHTFQVIATDQFGAAASQDFEIRVVEIEESNSDQE
jgi:hypothetical protein